MLSTAEIEREFRYEIQEKKRAASGVHHKTGKRGYTGVIQFPHNLLRGKEKREYTKPGKVRGYNMFTSLMTFMELQTHPEDRQKEILTKWRETYKAKEIQEALGMDHNSYYELLYKLEVLERPASAKPKKNTGVKRDKPEAQEQDIIKFNDLKLLPKEKQLEILDDYNEKYNLHSVAKIWGKDVKNVYSLRYTLRKKLGKPNIYETNVEQNVEKHKQPELSIKIEPKNEIFDEEKEIEEIERIEAENRMEPEAEQIIKEAIKEKDEVTGMNRLELEELKQLVFAQSRMLQEIMNQQQTAPTEVVNSEPKKAAMNFSFEDEKEGFLLHSDLERFISVLKKNPDQFKVEVKITRIEN
ncbi:hypothetical protein [Bacillus sp. MMSF_3328]|uniref:hypothetical protein n=1 Tax=Bacillus sp. MMSF_3328 TaxID=3047080 RepID=UPI00273D6637|nr:hypothetical protein [Bacillus sp. MMSF_3328]